MEAPSRSLSQYKEFIEFIRQDVQKERHRMHRRMLNAMFWCFGLPVIATIAFLVLIQFQVIPRAAKNYLDWMVLVFPVSYSIYVLSSEVLREVPRVFKRGGLASSLNQAVLEGEWRDRVCLSMRKALSLQENEWRWVVSCFEMDLNSLQFRNRYLTALGGAVFFLIMEGLDSMTGEVQRPVTFIKDPQLGWLDVSPDPFAQYVGLGLFLILLYLSGSQVYQNLKRYLDCARLLSQEADSGTGEARSSKK